MRTAIADRGLGIGLDAGFIAQQCDPGADVNAVFFRAALLQHMVQSGLLGDWHEGSEPATLVFQVGAAFPMEQGVQGFDVAAFIQQLQPEES